MSAPQRLDEFDRTEWQDIARRFGVAGAAFDKAWIEFKREKAAKRAN